MGELVPVPSLDELRADPAKAQTLPPATRQALTLQALTVLAALASVPAARDSQGAAPAPDADGGEWLSPAEVERRFGLPPRWLAEHRGELRRLKIVAQPSRKVFVYHARRLARLLEARAAGGSP